MTVASPKTATVQVWEEARNTGPSNRNACPGPASGPWDLFSTVAAGSQAFNGTITPAGSAEFMQGPSSDACPEAEAMTQG